MSQNAWVDVFRLILLVGGAALTGPIGVGIGVVILVCAFLFDGKSGSN